MTSLTVHEWGRVPVYNDGGATPEGRFSRRQANALLAAAKMHPLSGNEGTAILVDHHRHLTARQMVGVIAASGCSLEILPKIDPEDVQTDGAIRNRLVRMLDVALGLNLGDGQTAAMARQNETLLDILIRLFADRLLAEARRGLPRAYLAEQEDLAALRGRLNVVRQFTHNAVRPDRLACRFDTLLADTPLLRIMKACVLFLRRHARAAETIRRLDELRFLLADVGDNSPSSLPWKQVRIDRTNRRWETLYGLARLFLKRDWQATHHDASAGYGITLLFPMNKLFEAYIAALAKRALRGSDSVVIAQGGLLNCLIEEGEGGKERFQTKPDILIKHGSNIRMVIDTKWKRIGSDPGDSKRGVSQADIYQMMAYARLYRTTEVLLLYPHYDALGATDLNAAYSMLGGNERLRVVSVDLVSGEAAIVQRLVELACNPRVPA
ncbi:calmodulin-binding protein [Rhizobium sp. P44RR-XXIV]|uniref:McrC family protein n=1 Tax=Rhizobium sp. P44RR-XXIV TaxID=1921145 RepID=UPI0009869E50|nr:calmodulin-binding protein [Rhizobium sp. P44RR-XXIV]TIX93554.1 calmodulin-binding protein [Rhizobium sp. P44RR-XXIV]